MKLRHVVYSHREGLRLYFIDTQRPEKGAYLFLSINPLDIKYLIFGGIYFLSPPLKRNHIKGLFVSLCGDTEESNNQRN